MNVKSTSLQDIIQIKLKSYFDTLNGSFPPDGIYDIIIEQVEKPLLKLTLAHTGGNQIKAAKILGINRNTIRKKISHLDINLDDIKQEST